MDAAFGISLTLNQALNAQAICVLLVCRPGGLKQASQRCGCKGLEDHAWGKTFYKWETSVAPPGPLSELCLLFLCGIHHTCNYLLSICLLL